MKKLINSIACLLMWQRSRDNQHKQGQKSESKQKFKDE